MDGFRDAANIARNWEKRATDTTRYDPPGHEPLRRDTAHIKSLVKSGTDFPESPEERKQQRIAEIKRLLDEKGRQVIHGQDERNLNTREMTTPNRAPQAGSR